MDTLPVFSYSQKYVWACAHTHANGFVLKSGEMQSETKIFLLQTSVP